MHRVGNLQSCVRSTEAPAFTARPSDRYRSATAIAARLRAARRDAVGRAAAPRPPPVPLRLALRPSPPARLSAPRAPGAPPAHARCRRAVPPAGTRPRRCPGPRNVLRAATSRSVAAAVPFNTSKDLRAPAIRSASLRSSPQPLSHAARRGRALPCRRQPSAAAPSIGPAPGATASLLEVRGPFSGRKVRRELICSFRCCLRTAGSARRPPAAERGAAAR